MNKEELKALLSKIFNDKKLNILIIIELMRPVTIVQIASGMDFLGTCIDTRKLNKKQKNSLLKIINSNRSSSNKLDSSYDGSIFFADAIFKEIRYYRYLWETIYGPALKEWAEDIDKLELELEASFISITKE